MLPKSVPDNRKMIQTNREKIQRELSNRIRAKKDVVKDCDC